MKWEYELKTDPTLYSLHSVAQHWIETEIIIEQAAVKEVELSGPKWTPDVTDEASIGEFLSEKDLARYMHDSIMIPMHRNSCIVMLYSTVERELLRLVENLEHEKGQQKLKIKDINARPRLAQVSKFCEVFFNLKLMECPQYNTTSDLQKIRDCIIHCLGEVELSGDKDYLVKLSKQRQGFHASPVGEIIVGKECIKQFLIEEWSFFTWLFNKLNWKITSSYQGDKLGDLFKKLP